MYPEQVELLACPICKKALSVNARQTENGRVKEGDLQDTSGHSFPIIDFIPRFVSPENYASNFSVQWEHWPELLSQYDGYRVRFEQETKWGKDLAGKLILEAGCGSGAFTEFAAATGATVLSFDISTGGVLANYSRNKHLKNVLIVQADIYHIPARENYFDYGFCFGVLQHTPKPKDAFMEISRHLKNDSGKMASDIYTMPPSGHPYEPLWKNKYRMRRLVGWMSDRSIHRFVRIYVTMIWPLTRLILKLFPTKGALINRALLIDDYPPRLPGMDTRSYKSFAKLDIYDFLAPKYDFPIEQQEFISWHTQAGLKDIDIHPGYNGLEGRGTRATSSATEY